MSIDMTSISRELQGYPPILGLLAPLTGGKTTTADVVCAGTNGVRISCAGPIRDMLMALGVPREDLVKNKNKPQPWLYDRTGRELMISLGTEWGRTYVGPDIWINAVLQAAQTQKSRRPIIIDDIRFDNEAEAVKRAYGQLLYVYKPGVRYSYEHPSECGLSDWRMLDGVVSLISGDILSVREAFDLNILQHRPWWANYALGRRYAKWRNRKRAAWKDVSAPLKPPAEIGRVVAQAWGTWTYGGIEL